MATILNPLASAPIPAVNYAELRQLDLQRQALDHEEMFLNTNAYISGLPKEDQDALNSSWEWAPDPESSKRKSVNRGYIGDFYGLPDEALGEGGYQTYRDRYAKEVLGVPQGGELNDDSFFELMKEKQQKQRDYRGFAEYFATDALNSSLLLVPKDPYTEAARIGADTKMMPNMGKEESDLLAKHWVDQRLQYEERVSPLRPKAQEIYDMLAKGKDEGLTPSSKAGIEGAIDQLAMLAPDDRAIVVAMLKSQGGTDTTGALTDKLVMSAVRGLAGQFRGYSSNTERGALLLAQSELNQGGGLVIRDGETVDLAVSRRLIAAAPSTTLSLGPYAGIGEAFAGGRAATPEEVKQAQAIIERKITRSEVAQQAIGILEGTIDPIKLNKGQGTGLLGATGRYAQGLSIATGESFGAMAPIMFPMAGVLIAQGGYADAEYQKLREEGNDPATAHAAAQMTGALEAGFELAAFLFNFVPTSTIAKLTAAKAGSKLMGIRPALETSTTFRILSKMGTTQAAEYGEEIAQAAAPILTGFLGEQLGWNLAEQSKFLGEWKQFKEEGGFWRPEVFATVMMLAVSGGGYSGLSQSVQAKAAMTAMLGNQTRLESMGIAPAKAAEIVAMPEAERQAAYEAAYPERNPSAPEAVAAQKLVTAEVDAQKAKGAAEVQAMESEGLSITRTADGWAVTDLTEPDTAPIPHATAEEAMTTVRGIVKARGMKRQDSFLDALDEYVSFMESGRTIQLSNKSTNLLKELETAVTQNNKQWVEDIWDRADQERAKVGLDVLERDKTNPDSAAALFGMKVLGRSKSAAKGNVANAISYVMAGGQTLDLVEEQAENDLGDAVAAGETATETVEAILRRIETFTGDQYIFSNTAQGIKEAWAAVVRLYTTGTKKGNKITKGARQETAEALRIQRQAVRKVEESLTGEATGTKKSDLREKRQKLIKAEEAGITPAAFAKMREYLAYLKGIMGQVYRLQKARDAGLLDDLEAMIRESVGLKEQDALEAKVAEAVPTTYNLETGQGTSTFGYSIRAKRDADYLAAVENGDTVKQRTLVDDAAKAAGIPYVGVNINDSDDNYTGMILSGEKTVETRNSENNAFKNLVGERVAIVRTGTGKATVVGYATVGTPIRYNSVEEFNADFARHRVTGGKFAFSGFKIGYPMENVTPIDAYDAPPSNGQTVIKTRPIHALVDYDEQGNVIPLSERFGLEQEVDPTSPSTEPGEAAPNVPITNPDEQTEADGWQDIPWTTQTGYAIQYKPDAYPPLTKKIYDKIKSETDNIYAVWIDRMKVGSYKGIDLQGGMFYPTIEENLNAGVVWAYNADGVASGELKKAAQTGGYMKLILMQEGNVIGNKTFTACWFLDVRENIANGKLTSDLALKELNRVREMYQKKTEHTIAWETLEQAEKEITDMGQIVRGATYFQKSQKGGRISYSALLAQKMVKNGFPDGEAMVSELEEPAMKGLPIGTMVGIIQIDPNQKPTSAQAAGVTPHRSYKTVLKGRPIARMTKYNTVKQLFPEVPDYPMNWSTRPLPLDRGVGTGYSITTAAGLENIKAQLDKVAIDPDVRFNMMQRASENLSKMVRDIGFRDDVAAAANDAGMAQMEQQQATALAGVVDRYSAEEQQRLIADEEALKELKAKHETALQDLSVKADIEAGGAQADGWTTDQKDALKVRQRLEQTTLQARQRAETLALETKQQKATDAAKAKERQEVNLLKQEQAAQRKANEQKTGEREQRATMLDYLAALDTILMPFPAEVRNKVGGFVSLAGLRTNAAMNKYLKDRVEKLNTVLETYLRKDYAEQIKDLIKKGDAKRASGKKPGGKLGAEGHALFDAVKAAAGMSEEETNKAIMNLSDAIEKARSDNPDAVPVLAEKLQAAVMFGDLNGKTRTARDLANALKWLKENYERERTKWRMQEEARLAEITRLADGGVVSLGGSTTDSDRLNSTSELGEFRAGSSGFSGAMRALFGKDSELFKRWTAASRRAIIKRTTEFQALQKDWRDLKDRLYGKGWKGDRKLYDDIVEPVEKSGVLITDKMKKSREVIPVSVAENILAGKAPEIAERYTDEEKAEMRVALDANILEKRPKDEITLTKISGSTVGSEIMLSQGQAMHISLMWRQKQGRAPMEAHGYTEETIEQVEAFMSPEAKAIRDWIASRYTDEWGDLNAVFAGMFGVNLPQIENYSPLTFWSQQRKELANPDPSGGPIMAQGGMSTGMLKERVEKHGAEPRIVNAVDVFFDHMRQVAHFKAYAELAREIRGVMSKPEMRRALAVKHGENGTRLMDKWMDAIEQGGLTQKPGWFESQLSNMGGARAVAVLAWNFKSAFTNVLNLLGTARVLPPDQYLKGLARLFTGRLNWWVGKGSVFQNSKIIQLRINNGMSPEMQAGMSRIATMRPSRLKAFMEAGMALHAYSDAIFTSGSVAIAYDYHLREFLKDNPPEEAQRMAMAATEQTIADVTQPTEFIDKSTVELERNAQARAIFSFQSDPRQKMALQMQAYSEKDWARLAKLVFIDHVVTGLIMQTITNAWRDVNDDDDGDELFDPLHWQWKDYMIAMAIGPWSALPMFGPAIDAVGAAFKTGPAINESILTSAGSWAGRGVRMATSEKGKIEPYEMTSDVIKGTAIGTAIMTGDARFAVVARVGSTAFDLLDNYIETADESIAHELKMRRLKDKELNPPVEKTDEEKAQAKVEKAAKDLRELERLREEQKGK